MSKFNFTKIQTGQQFNFSKDYGVSATTTISFNLNWGMIGNEAVDLDAFLVLEQRNGKPEIIKGKKASWLSKLFGGKDEPDTVRGGSAFVDTVSFRKLQTAGVLHHGDDTTGAWSDGEFIEINLGSLDPRVNTLTFAVLSFSGHKFKDIPFAEIKVFTGKPDDPRRPLVEHCLKQFSANTQTVVLGQMVRKADGTWDFQAMNGQSPNKNVSGVTQVCKATGLVN